MRRTQGSGEQLQRIDKAELPPRWASCALICIRAVAAFAFAIAVSATVAIVITKPLPSHLAEGKLNHDPCRSLEKQRLKIDLLASGTRVVQRGQYYAARVLSKQPRMHGHVFLQVLSAAFCAAEEVVGTHGLRRSLAPQLHVFTTVLPRY